MRPRVTLLFLLIVGLQVCAFSFAAEKILAERLIEDRKVFHPSHPTYSTAFYRDWTWRRLDKLLERRYGLHLEQLDRRARLPIIYETSIDNIGGAIETFHNISTAKKPIQSHPESMYFPKGQLSYGNIYIAYERTSRVEYLIAHEFVHYVFRTYGEKLPFNLEPKENRLATEEKIAEAICKEFSMVFLRGCTHGKQDKK